MLQNFHKIEKSGKTGKVGKFCKILWKFNILNFKEVCVHHTYAVLKYLTMQAVIYIAMLN